LADGTPESAALALGELIGTVKGLVRTLEEQNNTASKTREEQSIAATASRKEFLDVFEGIRQDNKEQAKLMNDHILEDGVHHAATLKLVAWQEVVNPKIENLWDNQNKQKGAIVASGTIGSIIGGAVVAAAEWFKR
jgi:hypothetical protein